MEGSFPGLQSGFAVAHGVNLIAANAMAGGSGIWPADPLAVPIQYPLSFDTPLTPPQWSGTLELTSPAGNAHDPPAVPAPPAYRLVSNVTRFETEAGRTYTSRVSLRGPTCQLQLTKPSTVDRYLFGVSNGINFAGLFESSCWLVRCDVIRRQLFGTLSPSFLEQTFWPYTLEDQHFCAGASTELSPLGEFTIDHVSPS